MIGGLPLGACAVRDPRLEVLSRQLRWVVLLANLPGLVGSLHRQLAVLGDSPWKDPTPALSLALETVGWTLVRNMACLRASRWPDLDPEPSFRGMVVLQPASPGLPVPAATVWTDGSFGPLGGGAAVIQLLLVPLSLAVFLAPRVRRSVSWWRYLWWVSCRFLLRLCSQTP